MRVKHSIAVALTVLLLGFGLVTATGCGPGVGLVAGILVLVDGDETANAAPVVVVEVPNRSVGTGVVASVQVVDTDDDSVTLIGQYELLGGVYPATLTPSTVPASASGRTTAVTWDAAADLGSTAYTADLRLIVTADDGRDTASDASSPFAFGNDAPAITSLTLDTDAEGNVRGNAVVRVTVSDTASDPVDVASFELTLDGTFTDLPPIALTPSEVQAEAVPHGQFPTGAVTGLATSESGLSFSFAWDTLLSADLDAPAAQIRLTVQDAYGAVSDPPTVSAAFKIDNNFAPTAAVLNVTGRYDDLVPIQFQVLDNDDDAVTVLLEYSLDGQMTWHPCTPGPGSEPWSDLSSYDPGGSLATHRFVWSTLADKVFDRPGVFVRITPWDPYERGLSDVSVSFTVGNAGSTLQTIGTIPNGVQDLTAVPLGREIVLLRTGNTPTPEVDAYNPASNSWRSLAPIPTPRKRMRVAVLDGLLYATGGKDGTDTVVDLVEVYDPETDTWSAGVPMPWARYWHGLVVVDGQLIALGGLDASDTATDTVAGFTPGAGAWTPMTPLATPQSAGKATAIGDRVVLPLGMGSCDWYEPATGAYGTLTADFGSFSPSVVAWNGRGFLLGMFHGMTPIPATTPIGELDIDRDRIVFRTREIPNRLNPALAVLNDKIYLFGGTDDNGALDTVAVYAPAANVVSPGRQMLTDRGFTSTAVYEDRLWVIGGRGAAFPPSDTVQIYNPAVNGWTTGTSTLGYHAGEFAAGTGTGIDLLGENAERFDDASSTWSALPGLPTPRSYVAGGTIGTISYVIGGLDSSGAGIIGLVEAFDHTGAGSWLTSPLAAMPTPRYRAGAGVIDGRIYVAGGDGTGNEYLDTLEFYDPVSDTWSTGAPMPTGRRGPGVFAANGRLYVAGGSNTGGKLDVVEVYDPATGEWSGHAPLPDKRYGLSGATIGDTGFVAGGIGSFGGEADIYAIYSIPTPGVTVLRPVGEGIAGTPVDVAYPGVTGTRTTTYVAGGFDRNDDASDQVLAYRALDGTLSGQGVLTPNEPYRGDTWMALPALPSSRGGLGLAMIGGELLAIGGGRTTAVADAARDVDVFSFTSDKWTHGPALSQARMHAGVAVANGRVYVVGGENGTGVLDSVEVYEPSTGWSTGASMPTPRSHVGCMVHGRYLVVVGGQDASGKPLRAVERYDTLTNTWEALGDLPVRLTDVIAAGGHLPLAMGGFDGTDVCDGVYQYHADAGTWVRFGRLPEPLRGAGHATIHTGQTIAMGGRSPTRVTDTHWLIESR